MTTLNLTTLFTATSPLNNIASARKAEFRGNAIQTFPIDNGGAVQDNYITNPLLKKVLDVRNLKAAMTSVEVQNILRENKLPDKLNNNALDRITPHVKRTRTLAAAIASDISNSDVNLKDIQEAAMLHDIGKVLIPEKILGKKGALSEKEKEIMDLHSQLGYALLKQMGVNDNVLRLVKYHHQKPDGSGYPKAENDFVFDINAQILEAADKYSALTEDRDYHKACTKDEALSIIYKDVEDGIISQEVFEALKRSV